MRIGHGIGLTYIRGVGQQSQGGLGPELFVSGDPWTWTGGTPDGWTIQVAEDGEISRTVDDFVEYIAPDGTTDTAVLSATVNLNAGNYRWRIVIDSVTSGNVRVYVYSVSAASYLLPVSNIANLPGEYDIEFTVTTPGNTQLVFKDEYVNQLTWYVISSTSLKKRL